MEDLLIAVAAYLLIRIESKLGNLSTILSIKLGGDNNHKAA